MLFEIAEIISSSLVHCDMDIDINFNSQLSCEGEKEDILISDLTPSSIDDHQTYGVIII